MVASQNGIQMVERAGLLADEVWQFVAKLPELEQRAIYVPMAQAADSIGASLAKAYGHEDETEKVRCLFAARAGVFETKFWVNRCQQRGVLTAASAERHGQQLAQLARQINEFLRTVRSPEVLDQVDGAVREAPAGYGRRIGLPAQIFDEEALEWLAHSSSASIRRASGEK